MRPIEFYGGFTDALNVEISFFLQMGLVVRPRIYHAMVRTRRVKKAQSAAMTTLAGVLQLHLCIRLCLAEHVAVLCG